MAVIASKTDTTTPAFGARREEMAALVAEHRRREQAARTERSERTLAHLAGLGKLPVRRRLDLLLDPKAGFLELSPLAAHDLYDGDAPQAGMVTGVGRVAGRRVVIVANDPSVKGGTLYPLGVKKWLRAQEIAMENRLPVIALVDSGGAFLPLQSELFADREHGGRAFYNQARMARMGIPQIAVVCGHCTAGGAYLPAMSDQVIMVKGTGAIFLAGPPLVKAATGQEVGVEELGGAAMHTATSGVADYLADDEPAALALARELAANLPPTPLRPGADRTKPAPPRYDPSELYGIVPVDLRRPFEVRDVLARVLDGSELSEFKPRFGRTLVCGFARIDGWRVGVLANDGVLFSEAALKATQFIQLCDARETPLVFFHNVNGFMVGKEVEQGGIAKHGAKMVNAVANARVPKLTVITGGSFGAGNYAMCGRAFGGRFLFTWPGSRVSVMGGDAAASVLATVTEDKARRLGNALDEAARARIHREITAAYDAESSALFATARLWDDGIIDPVDTRSVLSQAIEATSSAPLEEPGYGWMRM
ncbi:MAG: carboxyl transferase domain-containing protein [Planctomycetota bacterium]|jgi:acetyl-CoA carboxylase carboxyltransferase component|nr:carboxyl transferase domain-containing protein [Planctomycetota bacterium]MDP6764115.1 carboxyl transferase domain-containing protein [Planctomycetota bacterium]MDP6989596.1 carboxyl transferase domain-containing protein [Planctomycetota bacterium]